MGLGIELEISGNNEGLVAALKESRAGFDTLSVQAVKGTDTMAKAAQSATQRVQELSQKAAGMGSRFQTAADLVARSSAAQAAAIDHSRAVMDDYANALEGAEGHVREFSEAMQDSAEIQARSAARAAQAQEQLQGRFSRAFDAMRNKVRTVSTEMSASWKAAQDKIGPEKWEAAMNRMRESSEEFQRRSVRAFKAVGVALAGLATASFVVGASFEQSMARVGAATSATPAELVAMTNEAKRLGVESSISAKQVAEGMKVIADSTGDAAETISITREVAKLAGAGFMEFAEAGDLVTQMLDAFSLSGADAARVVNVLAAGVGTIGEMDMNSLRTGLASVANAAGNAGLSIEQTVAMLALLDAGGQKATKSAAGLQAIFGALLDPSEQLRALMGGMTVEGNGMMAVMQQLASQGARLNEVFERRQRDVILTFARAGAQAFDDMTAAVTGTSAAQVAFDRNQGAVLAQLQRLKNMVADVLISAFQELSGVSLASIDQMQAAVERYKTRVVDMVARVRDWVVAHKGQIAAAAEFAVKIGPVVIGLGLLLKGTNLVIDAAKSGYAAWTLWRGAFALIVPAINAVTVSMGGVAVASASMAGPIGLAALAIAGLVGWMIKWNAESKAAAANIPATLASVSDAMSEAEKRATKLRDMISRGVDITNMPVYRAELLQVEARIETLRAAHAKMAGEAIVNFAKMAHAARDAAAATTPGLSEFAQAAHGGRRGTGAPKTATQAAEKAGGGGSMATFTDWGVYLAAQGAALARAEDLHRASLIRQAAMMPLHTAEGLAAREALIQNTYQHEIATAEGSASRIAELTIQRDADLADVRKANQDGVYKHWVDSHQGMMLIAGGLAAAYDSVINQMIQGELRFKSIREAAWAGFKRTVITGAAQMFKAYVGEQLKALVIAETAKDKANAKQRFADAKAGGAAAFHAFAGIPFVGPALGAAAAAAAFAFLIAFHSGGYVGRFAPRTGNEIIARLQPGEYVMQRQAVERIGTQALDYQNSTGRIPERQGGGTFAPHIHLHGDPDFVRNAERFLDEDLIPYIEDAMRDGRLRGTLSPSRSAA